MVFPIEVVIIHELSTTGPPYCRVPIWLGCCWWLTNTSWRECPWISLNHRTAETPNHWRLYMCTFCVYMYRCMYVYIYIYLFIYIYVYIYVYIYMYIYIYVYIYICIYIYVCTCILISIDHFTKFTETDSSSSPSFLFLPCFAMSTSSAHPHPGRPQKGPGAAKHKEFFRLLVMGWAATHG